MTYMWKEERGKPYYQIQTDDRSIASKLNRRVGFTLSARGINIPFWKFSTNFANTANALRFLKSIIGHKIFLNKKESVWQDVELSE